MIKRFPLFVFLFLIACTNQAGQTTENQGSVSSVIDKYMDENYGYEIIADFNTPKGDWSSRTTAAGKTVHSLWNGNLNNGLDVFADIYHPNSSCSPRLTGTSQTTEIPNTNGKTYWGRMDVWDNTDGEGVEFPSYWKEVICPYNEPSSGIQTYALCSEKNNRTVVICMTQQTDNPSLAKQIFETFRWTDDK